MVDYILIKVTNKTLKFVDRWMSPSTLQIQSRLPCSQPTDIQTPPELPQRDVLRQRPHSNPHSDFFSVSFLNVFFTVFIYYFLIADSESPFLFAVRRNLDNFSPTTF